VAAARSQRSARKTLAVSATTLAAIIFGPSISPSISYAEPPKTLSQVKREVDTLQLQAEQATERYNEERVRLRELQRRVAAVQTKTDDQQAKVASLQHALGEYADFSFRMGAIDPTIQLMFGENPEVFLRDSGVISRLTEQQVALLNAVQGAQRQLGSRQADLAKELQTLSKSREKLLAEKKEIEGKLAKAEKLLASLKAEERAQLERASRSSTRSGSSGTSTGGTYTGPATGDVRAVLNFAYAQLGEPYVYGAAGPDAWDCSGLTMMAWRQAGVSLPHSSRMQYDQGRKVSRSELQPGDLVYFYSPISHVAIYIGGGEIIHATHPGSVVSKGTVSSMPYAGATRP
jgi:cell wall-associated NlpC family hydrolase